MNALLQIAGSDLQAQMQPVDLSQMPGATPDNPMYIIDTGRPEVQKVEIVNTPKMVVDGGVLDGVRNPVDVKQVGVLCNGTGVLYADQGAQETITGCRQQDANCRVEACLQRAHTIF